MDGMSRTRDPNGKHVTLALRVTSEKAAEIDVARGTVTRAAWLAGLVDAALERGGGQDDTLHRTRANPRAAGAASPRGAQPPARRCTHQGTRVIGGWCPPCQHAVKPGGEWA